MKLPSRDRQGATKSRDRQGALPRTLPHGRGSLFSYNKTGLPSFRRTTVNWPACIRS